MRDGWATRALVVGAVLGLVCVAAVGQNVAPVSLRVDVAAGRHAINPEIYGIVSYGLDPAFAAEIKVPNVRWGGDGTTQYNWKVDSSNAGFDWYFMSGGHEANPVAGAGVDTMVAKYGAVGARGLVTIPIIPFVNKSATLGCSFPVAVYGKQQSVNPYEHLDRLQGGGDCGNSLAADGKQLVDKDVYANHIDNSVALQKAWVEHLVARFGTAAKGGVPFYQLDNEPGGWGNTHRDVMPGGADYSTIVRLGEQYAAMVKQVDATALVLGPSDFTHAGWIGAPAKQDGLFAGQYYLRAMAAYEKAHGARLLDYFDEHYYPEFTDGMSQMASSQTLWDARYATGNWVEKSFFHGPMRLIPRFKEWIAGYYPGTKLAFSEYSIASGKKRIEDALAEADVLGIFGSEGVDLANMWDAPKPDEPMAFAFRVFRNYDGKGGMFGENGVEAVSSDRARLAVYASTRGSDGALTIVVLNKTAAVIEARVEMAHVKAGKVRVFEYGGGELKRILDRGSVDVGKGYGFPGMSATVMVVAGD